MADQQLNEGPSSSNVSGESSDSIVEINIKTLDSQIYSFQVEKNMPVSSFKEKIATDIGIPVVQQRLIFRGKVLKDDHLLSEYHVENGHTLHLVVRQPTQSQPSPDTSSGETNGSNGTRGNDANAGAPRNRVGQISHSVLLGTFNVGDQGEGIAPELNRVIGAVINSLGIGGQAATNGIQFSSLANTLGQVPQGNEADGTRGTVGSQSQDGSQTGQAFPGQSFSSSQAVQIPPAAAALPIPSLHAPIPDSLNTLSEFMNRMEQALSQNGSQPNSSSSSNEDITQVELPSNGRGLPTPEALSTVLRHAERLLGGHAVAALSHVAGRLEQQGASSDPSIRGQIQAETAQVGLAMQHLGSLLLELGRVILTLRMGQSPGEASVNSGPAVYISPSGPNPIMVQPFPLQTSSLFGGSAPSSNPISLGPVGIGSAPRHINIHIHAGTALAPVVSTVGTRASNGDAVQVERGSSTGSADSAGSVRVVPVRNVIAAAVPSRAATGVAISTSAQPGRGFSVSTQPGNSVLLSSVINEVNSQIRNLVGSMQGENQVGAGEVESNGQNLSGGNISSNAGNEEPRSTSVNRVGETSQPGVVPESEDQKAEPECHQVRNNEDMGNTLSSKDALSSSVEGSQSCLNGEPAVNLEGTSENTPGLCEKQCLPEGAKAVPLGLGLGGLERKRRIKQLKTPVKSVDGGTSSAPVDQKLDARSLGQQLLQSLAPSSVMNQSDANDPSSGQPLAGRTTESRQSGGQDNGQLDTASAMSQALRSSEINGLLSGFSEQTGVGSPDVLRNMLLQLTQSPQVMNTVNQIAQQIDGQDLGNMFSGLGGGQGGGFDLSRMVQQMMPVVSQALTGGSAAPQHNDGRASGVDSFDDQNSEIGVRQVAQRIERCDPPEEVFRAIVENAGRLHSNGSPEDLVDDLCNDEVLAHEYAELLQYDIRQRLKGDSGRDKC